MPDRYRDFAELAAAEPDDAYSISLEDRGSPVVVAAPHGGGIEPGTSETVLAIAGENLSYYLFEGIKASGNGDLHITSTRFDEPRCLALLRAAEMVLTVHGERGDTSAVYLGGLHDRALEKLHVSLSKDGFQVRRHTDHRLQGRHGNNICNMGIAGAGVQLELSRKLRDSFFDLPYPSPHRRPTAVLDRFAQAVKRAIADPAGYL